MPKRSINMSRCKKKEDITGQKSKLMNDFFKIIVQNAKEAFFVTDMVGNIIEVNDAMCQKLGYSRDELLSMTPFGFDIEVINNPKDLIRDLLNEKELGETSDVRHAVCKDGRILDVETNTKYLDIGSGIIFHFGRDVTERNKLYQQLEESEERYRALIELGDRVGEAVVMTKRPYRDKKLKPKKQYIALKAQDPEIFNSLNFRWRVSNRYIDYEDEIWGWGCLSLREFFDELLPRLHDYETMTWNELFIRESCHDWSIDEIPTQARNKLKVKYPEIDTFHQVDLAQPCRLLGYRDRRDFYPIWYDPDHKICPTKRR